MGKDLGVLEDEKLNMSKHSALAARKANSILGCIKRWVDSREREVTVALCSPYKAPSGVLCPCLGLQHKKDAELLNRVQKRAIKMISGLKHLSYEEWLR